VSKFVTKSKSKQRRCAWCRKLFKPPQRGRPPRYCCRSHRQRAYERRCFVSQGPRILLGQDLEDWRTQSGINRAVVDALRKLGFVPPAPKRPPPLRLVKDDPETEGK
jgi:hypothetical protein